MERRTVIAVLLILGVLVVTPVLFPTKRVPVVTPPSTAARVATPRSVNQGVAVQPNTNVDVKFDTSVVGPKEVARTLPIEDALSRSEFSSNGGSLERVRLNTYKALDHSNGQVSLTAGATPLLSYRVVAGADTIRLRDYVFGVEEDQRTPGRSLTFVGQAGPHSVRIQYQAVRDSFITKVGGTITGPQAGNAFLLIDLPATLRSFEADTTGDQSSLSYAVKSGERSAEGVSFNSLDPGERKIIAGPITWTVTKSKYFIVGLLPDSGNTQYVEAQVVGGAKTSSTATFVQGTVVARLGPDGGFAFDLYAGPQQYRRLVALGRDFQNSNPYGGWLQGVVQPFATMVMKILLWMKATLGWSYGALLVLFGVVVRVLMWPLQQGAMRTTMKMQRIQPSLTALQTKYKSDPQKLQSEMMRLYKEHDMSPFSAFAGCLPILLPMPVLFALFFVFQNTIEFRGVSFLWLADISLKDPFYIVPLLMGVSMFVLSWIGLRNSPPNQQAKMMAYIMPVMMTVLFANFASGLNLYYAVQNVAALPQQWLISNERGKAKT